MWTPSTAPSTTRSQGVPPVGFEKLRPVTVVRYLHLLAMAFFVGGQLMMVAAIAPVVRDDPERMRALARRFGR